MERQKESCHEEEPREVGEGARTEGSDYTEAVAALFCETFWCHVKPVTAHWFRCGKQEPELFRDLKERARIVFPYRQAAPFLPRACSTQLSGLKRPLKAA